MHYLSRKMSDNVVFSSLGITTLGSKKQSKSGLQDGGTSTAESPAKGTPQKESPKQRGGGKKGCSGPPPFNINALQNGGQISRLTLGALPDTMRRQLQNARKYRRYLEELCVVAHGGVNATQAHLIDECATAEIHARVCQWLLRTRISKMKSGDIIKCSEQILKSKTIRNKALMALKVDAPPEQLSLQDYIVEAGH